MLAAPQQPTIEVDMMDVMQLKLLKIKDEGLYAQTCNVFDCPLQTRTVAATIPAKVTATQMASVQTSWHLVMASIAVARTCTPSIQLAACV